MAKKKRTFQYKKRDASKLQERANKTTSAFATLMKDPVKMLKLENGDYHVRVCPPTWDDAEHYGYDVAYNRNFGPDKDRYISRSFLGHSDDAARDYINELKADGHKSEAKDKGVSDRVFYYVIDRKNEGAGPLVLDVPQGVDAELAKACKDRRSGASLDIDCPDDGFDVFFTREKNQKGFPVIVRFALDRPSPMFDDEARQDEVLDWLVEHPLPDYLNVPENEELERLVAAMKAANPSKRAEDDDTTPPPRTRSRAQRPEPEPEQDRPATRSSRPEPEPEIDDDDADLDEPAPQTGGLRKRSRRPAMPEPGPIDDDDVPF